MFLGAPWRVLSRVLSSLSLLNLPFTNPMSAWRLDYLSEPLREAPGALEWPFNVSSQSPHTPMAEELDRLSEGMLRTAHVVVGQSGYGMEGIQKGGSVPSYTASLLEAERLRQLLHEQGFVLKIGAVLLTHGETDHGSASYMSDILTIAGLSVLLYFMANVVTWILVDPPTSYGKLSKKEKLERRVDELRKCSTEYLGTYRSARQLAHIIEYASREDILKSINALAEKCQRIGLTHQPSIQTLEKARVEVKYRLEEEIDPEKLLAEDFDTRLSRCPDPYNNE